MVPAHAWNQICGVAVMEHEKPGAVEGCVKQSNLVNNRMIQMLTKTYNKWLGTLARAATWDQEMDQYAAEVNAKVRSVRLF